MRVAIAFCSDGFQLENGVCSRVLCKCGGVLLIFAFSAGKMSSVLEADFVSLGVYRVSKVVAFGNKLILDDFRSMFLQS